MVTDQVAGISKGFDGGLVIEWSASDNESAKIVPSPARYLISSMIDVPFGCGRFLEGDGTVDC